MVDRQKPPLRRLRHVEAAIPTVKAVAQNDFNPK
jgi:hypothetical protein